MLKFKIEQVALCPTDPVAARELLTAMGAQDFHLDRVVARGEVMGNTNQENTAELAFEYGMLKEANELEILHYTEGKNWMDWAGPVVSHFGMHCSEEELDQWKAFFAQRGIPIAQEVRTDSHTNPVIADSRRYHYCIFHTRPILSVDIKFIVRRDI